MRSIDEAVGRADLLRMNRAIDFYKARNLDFEKILTPVSGGKVRFDPAHAAEELDNFDRRGGTS